MSSINQHMLIVISIVLFVVTSSLQAAPAYWDTLPLDDKDKAAQANAANTVAFSQDKQFADRFFGNTKPDKQDDRAAAPTPTSDTDNFIYRSAPPALPSSDTKESIYSSAPALPPESLEFSVYRKVDVKVPEHLLIRSQATFDGLAHQADYLRKNKRNPYLKDKGLPLDHGRLAETISALQAWLSNDHALPLTTQFDLYQVEEKDNPRHVRFTGYYTETLAARRKPDTVYRYPVYGVPDYIKPLPSRNEINRGALQGKNLELGWVKDKIGLYFMQIQGSGYLQFDDDSTQLLSFAAKNKHPYSSIGRYMSDRGYLPPGKITNELVRNWLETHPNRIDEMLNTNPSYVFFKRSYGSVLTAARVPATTGHTVSVDTDYIPFGSVLLAKVPLKDTDGKLKGYDWRLLFPQDRGTAVEGPGHVDLYMGAGPEARKKSDSLSLYGTVYILLKRS